MEQDFKPIRFWTIKINCCVSQKTDKTPIFSLFIDLYSRWRKEHDASWTQTNATRIAITARSQLHQPDIKLQERLCLYIVQTFSALLSRGENWGLVCSYFLFIILSH